MSPSSYQHCGSNVNKWYARQNLFLAARRYWTRRIINGMGLQVSLMLRGLGWLSSHHCCTLAGKLLVAFFAAEALNKILLAVYAVCRHIRVKLVGVIFYLEIE